MWAVSCTDKDLSDFVLWQQNVIPEALKIKKIILNTEREGEATFRCLHGFNLNMNHWKTKTDMSWGMLRLM